MIKPSERYCDFCSQRILDGEPWSKVSVPLLPSVRQEVIDTYTKEFPPRSGSILQFMPIEAQVPHTWPLEMCTGCTTGLLPMAMLTAKAQIQDSLKATLDQKRRTVDAMAALEDNE